MTYTIRMGIPEMAELWNKLQTSYRDGTINKKMQNSIRNGDLHLRNWQWIRFILA